MSPKAQCHPGQLLTKRKGKQERATKMTKDALSRLKKKKKPSMSRAQYRAALKKLGISHVGAGKVFGLYHRHAQRFATGESPVPEPLAKLIRLMVRLNLRPEDVE
jgi:hypothetical protein